MLKYTKHRSKGNNPVSRLLIRNADWLFVTHYGYDAAMDYIVDLSDQFVTHYFFVIVPKAGTIHGIYTRVKHVHKRRTCK